MHAEEAGGGGDVGGGAATGDGAAAMRTRLALKQDRTEIEKALEEPVAEALRNGVWTQGQSAWTKLLWACARATL